MAFIRIVKRKDYGPPPAVLTAEPPEPDTPVPDKPAACAVKNPAAPVAIEAESPEPQIAATALPDMSDTPVRDKMLVPETITPADSAVAETMRPETLADVIDHLTQNNTLSTRRKRDLISACNSVARLLGRSPNDLPADVPALRDLIAALHHVQAGTTRKRLSNIRADLAAALEVTSVIPPRDLTCEPSTAWRDFLEHATKPHHSWFLSRFSRYCSQNGVEPVAVTDAVLQGFHAWLDMRVLTADPKKVTKNTAVAFNAIIKRAGLDMPLLTTALSPRHLTRRLDTYPQTLTDDIQRYLKRLREPDLFSEDGPRRALRPMSLRNVEAHVRQVLDAAVAAGYEPSHFHSLADLIDLDVIKVATDHMIARRDGKTPSSLANILATLLAIARYYVRAPTEVLRKLALAKGRISEKLGTNRTTMSEKTQRRMDQFEDRENIFRLLELPAILMKRADKNTDRKSAAFDAMIAAAIAILLSTPMRIRNLSGLHMTEDMTFTKQGRNVIILIHLVPSQTKGRQAIDALIEPPYSTMIARYVNTYRRHFADKGSDWLFPAASGNGPRTPDHFGGLLKDAIFRETGLVANPHLFRSFSAFVYLEAHPGKYEDARRLVGHAKLETTTAFYAPTSSKAAFRRYNDVLRSLNDRKPRK
ncbi:tyrosine-type recombinase/integrase [Brucella intermedia]|uniref:tyrosine-type recombinase/integrase n=1 Tax=Brucella intermedia TaxID=94625 RepID=UPI00224B405F|nr:tyrosine-type recombinase/integrase [Brucella intermedia]